MAVPGLTLSRHASARRKRIAQVGEPLFELIGFVSRLIADTAIGRGKPARIEAMCRGERFDERQRHFGKEGAELGQPISIRSALGQARRERRRIDGARGLSIDRGEHQPVDAVHTSQGSISLP